MQFEPLIGLRTPQFAQLWTKFRARYPRLEEQPSLEPVSERFDVRRPFGEGLQIRLVDGTAVPRYWFMNDEGTELIQVQQDRFIVNWRRAGTDAPYPQYTQIRRRFVRELSVFERFLEDEGIGPLVPNQAEVTYVDEIAAGKVWQRHGQVDEVISLWAPHDSGFPPEPESVALSVRYLIRRDDEPVGRLHVDLQPLYRRVEDVPIFLLTMTARGGPEGVDIPGVLKFMDLGQDWIVRTFVSLTTEKMHEAWGQRHGG